MENGVGKRTRVGYHLFRTSLASEAAQTALQSRNITINGKKPANGDILSKTNARTRSSHSASIARTFVAQCTADKNVMGEAQESVFPRSHCGKLG